MKEENKTKLSLVTLICSRPNFQKSRVTKTMLTNGPSKDLKNKKALTQKNNTQMTTSSPTKKLPIRSTISNKQTTEES